MLFFFLINKTCKKEGNSLLYFYPLEKLAYSSIALTKSE